MGLKAVFIAVLAAARANPTLESRIRGAAMAPLVADALTLGTHYEYDATKIKKFYGEIDQYYAPGQKTGGETHGVGWGARNFHNGNGNGPAKRAGEQTDYGDYNILIAKHLANTAKAPHRMSLKELIPFWRLEMRHWRSWICTQSRNALKQVAQGVPHSKLGGHSNAMAIRNTAAFAYFDNEEDLVHASNKAMFTHKEPTALQGGEFFTRVTYRVIHKGLTPREAIEEVAALSSDFIKAKVRQAVDKVAEATNTANALFKEEFADDLSLTSMARLWDVGKTEPIKVGKASPTEGTLPGSIYFILKYENDFAAAARANAMVGGDNASRSIAIGMVLGAYQGMEAIPPHLGEGHLTEWRTMQTTLDRMPLLRAESKQEL